MTEGGLENSETNVIVPPEVAIRRGERKRLWKRALSARRTAGESGFFTRLWRWFNEIKYTGDDEFDSFYAKNSEKFAKDIVATGGLPQSLVAVLDELKKPGQKTPYFIARGLYPTRWKFGRYSRSLAEPAAKMYDSKRTQWYIRKRVYDLVSTALLHRLGTLHRPKKAGESIIMYRDYLTDPHGHHDQFTRDKDISLRFRPVDPELLFETDSRELGDIAPRFAIFVCVENPIADSLLLLPVQAVTDRLDPLTRHALQERNFQLYDHWAQDLTQPRSASVKRLLRYDGDDPSSAELLFDPNRINLQFPSMTSADRAAVGVLRDKIKQARGSAIKVLLNRGDALIIDNYRAMVARLEAHHGHHGPCLWRKPPVRWVRLYAGFRRQKESD